MTLLVKPHFGVQDAWTPQHLRDLPQDLLDLSSRRWDGSFVGWRVFLGFHWLSPRTLSAVISRYASHKLV